MTGRIALIDGVRTPFVKAFDAFKRIPAYELARIALVELLERTEIDKNLIDEVIFGAAATPYEALSPARIIAVQAKLPIKTTGETVSRNCASGIQSITNAFERIHSGSAEVVVAGGMESMSCFPVLFDDQMRLLLRDLSRAKTPIQRLQLFSRFRLGYFKPHMGLMVSSVDMLSGLSMGETAEVVAKEFKISRKEQDDLALKSHLRAVAAAKEGRLKEEITPVIIPPKYEKVVDQDIGMREDINPKGLAKLRPVFDREYGSVTAGNASMVTDGAGAVLLMKEEKAKALGYDPLGYIRSYAYVGVEPEKMSLGAAHAPYFALRRAGLKIKDIELIEINEAFAATVLVAQKCFASKKYSEENFGEAETFSEIDPDKVNVNGGAIALGHPLGATGTRLVITLLKEMKRRNLKLGLATMCVGGGQGGAIILER